MAPLFHIVLHEPEIPNNTGNIGRTCVATGCALHLVRPLGFDTSEHALRRAGLDYWRRLSPREHADWGAWVRWWGEEGKSAPHPARDARRPLPAGERASAAWVFSTKASRPLWGADLRPGDALIFGKETAGLPEDVVRAAGERAVCLPMLEGERSLNLATAVCAAVMEGLRQCAARGDIALDAHGRYRWAR